MRIALINPLSRRTVGYHSIATKIPPLGLQVLARRAGQVGHHVEIIDEIFGADRTEQIVRERGYDLVGLTSYTPSVPRAYELAAFCRQEGLPCMLGGPHAWACPDEAQPHVDSLVVGEADEIWPGILADASAERLQPRYTGGYPQLNTGVGRADQDIGAINGAYDVACIQTSRGCPIGCDFCSVTLYNGNRIRRRSTDDIVAEWNEIKKPFVFVVDDNFFGTSPTHAEDACGLLEQIIARGKRKHWFSQTSFNMGAQSRALRLAYRAGCRAMLVGIESFNEDNLAEYNKALNRKLLGDYQALTDGFHRAGIAILGGFVIGADHDDENAAVHTLRQAVELGVDIIQMTNLTPLPGTKLYERLQRDGRLLATNYPEDWERYTFIETVYQPAGMDAKSLDRAMYEIRRLAMKRSWVWKRTLRTLWTTRSLTTALFVHGMNRAWSDLARACKERDRTEFAGWQPPPDRAEQLRLAFSMTGK